MAGGDPPEGVGKPFSPHPEGYKSAAELVAGIRKIGDFDISVAAYPEKHPQSPSWDADIDNLKRKLDAGANRAVTQMFFDNGDYFRFVDRARKAGITAPIVPGIQPIHSFKQISGFASRCGASPPTGRWHRTFRWADSGPRNTCMRSRSPSVSTRSGAARPG